MMSSFFGSDLKIINFVSCIIGSTFPLKKKKNRLLNSCLFLNFIPLDPDPQTEMNTDPDPNPDPHH